MQNVVEFKHNIVENSKKNVVFENIVFRTVNVNVNGSL